MLPSATGAVPPLKTAAPSRAQRKTVTVLFCDVTGSTALGERLDPESLREVMRRYFDAARKVIEQHGGTVEKFIGDAVMAVFGVPVLHEDDALRAVRAAIGLRDALADLNGELERDYGTTVTVRTGVNTGPVVTGTEERLATGDAVNLAARLEQAAAPGEIVIGHETWALVRDLVTAELLAPMDLKGKSLPVSAYRLLGMAGDRVDRAGSAMVGRSTQLRMLNDAFANVSDGRSCSMFTVLGAAGVGKSRLTTEFLDRVDATQVRGPLSRVRRGDHVLACDLDRQTTAQHARWRGSVGADGERPDCCCRNDDSAWREHRNDIVDGDRVGASQAPRSCG